MYQSIFIDEFSQLAKTKPVTIVDVREVEEYKQGHIAHAINLPLSELENRYVELDQTSPFFVICHSGGRSTTACQFLGGKGFRVTNVMGGMSSWKGEIVQ